MDVFEGTKFVDGFRTVNAGQTWNRQFSIKAGVGSGNGNGCF